MGEERKAPGKPKMFRCPSCSANLLFEPVDGCLSCAYCGRKEKIPERPEEIQENSYEAYLKVQPNQLHSSSEQFVEHQCAACGAILELPGEQAAGQCPFCAAGMVLLESAKDPLIAPEAVLPMSVTAEAGRAAVKRWLESRWFAPNSLKQYAKQEALQGIYLPYWTFDANTSSHYQGERGEYYYETETVTEYVDGKPRQVERQTRRIRWHHADGWVTRWFDDLTVPASLSLKQNHLASLDPWDLEALAPFDAAFLSGFKAERYRVQLPAGFDQAKQIMRRVIVRDVEKDIGGDEQRVESIQTAYTAITFKHVLLPVWAGAYRLQGKVYQVVVNGRNGLVQGDRPYSVWKILFALLLIFGVLGALLEIRKSQSSRFSKPRSSAVLTPGPHEFDDWRKD